MKKLIALLLTLVMVLGLAACAAKTGGSDTQTQTYAIITKAAGNPYNEREAAGFEEVMKDAGYNAIIKHPAEITAEAQITLINELVAQKVSGIAIAANDFDALETALKAAMDAGIKVVSCDSSCNPASRMTHINQAGVQEVAQCLVDATYDLLGGEGDWAILSATSIATNQNAWIDAMKEILKDEKGHIRALKTVRLAGREPVPGTETELHCNLLLIAAGFVGCMPMVPEAFGVGVTERGRVLTEDYQTEAPGVFCAGDMRRGQSLVVWAIREGREAACRMDRFLMGYSELEG